MTVFDDTTNAVVGMVPVAVGAGLLDRASHMGERPKTRVVLKSRPKEKTKTVTKIIVLKSPSQLKQLKASGKLRVVNSKPHKAQPPTKFGRIRRYKAKGGTLITRRSLKRHSRRR